MKAVQPDRRIVRRAVMALAVGVLLPAILVEDTGLHHLGPNTPGGVCVRFRGGPRVDVLWRPSVAWYVATLGHQHDSGGIAPIVTVGFYKTLWCDIGHDRLF